MTIESIADSATPYYLIAFDERSTERPGESGGLTSQQVESALKEQPITDVFFLSHGWRGDIAAAKTQYARWIKAMSD
jgi:hypothetical protein